MKSFILNYNLAIVMNIVKLGLFRLAAVPAVLVGCLFLGSQCNKKDNSNEKKVPAPIENKEVLISREPNK